MVEAHQDYFQLRDLPLPELLDLADHVSDYLSEKNEAARSASSRQQASLYDQHNRPIR